MNKDNKQKIELLNERISQIYIKLNGNSNFKKIKKREDNLEKKIENILKNENQWELYDKYEDTMSELLYEMFKEFYLSGFNDGISMIISNK